MVIIVRCTISYHYELIASETNSFNWRIYNI